MTDLFQPLSPPLIVLLTSRFPPGLARALTTLGLPDAAITPQLKHSLVTQSLHSKAWRLGYGQHVCSGSAKNTPPTFAGQFGNEDVLRQAANAFHPHSQSSLDAVS
jgi:hypothetical protein